MSGFGIYYARTDFDLPFEVLENYTVDSSLLYNRRFENLQEFFDEGLYGKALLVSKLSPQAIIFNVYTSENKISVITFECPDRETEKSDLSKYIFVSNNDGYFETNYEQGGELNENQ